MRPARSRPTTVQAAIQANTYVVSGTAEEKSIDQMLPSIWSQLGANLGDPEMAKKLAAQLKAGAAGSAAAADDDVPELVENFECVAQRRECVTVILTLAAAASPPPLRPSPPLPPLRPSSNCSFFCR